MAARIAETQRVSRRTVQPKNLRTPTGGLPYPVNSRRRHRISISITLIRHHPFGARPLRWPMTPPAFPMNGSHRREVDSIGSSLVSVHKRKLLKSLKESNPWREGPAVFG